MEVQEQIAEQLIDLSIISAAIHHGCMGLPQELIDQIMDMLRDDPPALKACSLTCKAMFASSRHLIHRTLYLNARNIQSILTRGEEQKLLQKDLGSYHDAKLRFVSYIGERGLLRYTRRVHIRNGDIFTPETLLPHLHHFQSLDKVHTLTIEHYDALSWANYYATYFVHFYPTLISLSLSHPSGRYIPLLKFALQFPNLENLCLEWFPVQREPTPNPAPPVIVDRSPPLRGHLRLVGYPTTGDVSVVFACELSNDFNFRTVELEYFFRDRVQHILDSCADTLENLTIVPAGLGKHLLSFLLLPTAKRLFYFLRAGDGQLGGLELGRIAGLRRFTLRMKFDHVSNLRRNSLLEVLSTITSPVFCEFVLEVDVLPVQFNGSYSKDWGCWTEIDRLLKKRFARHGTFRLVIRTGKLDDEETFKRHAKERFPLLAKKGYVHFERFDSIENRWPS